MVDHEDYYSAKAKICEEQAEIPVDLYDEYDVKKGLRDKNGKGVLTGITRISRLDGYKTVDGVRTPIDGILEYRGYNINDLVSRHVKRCGFEETSYLLLFGNLPTMSDLKSY